MKNLSVCGLFVSYLLFCEVGFAIDEVNIPDQKISATQTSTVNKNLKGDTLFKKTDFKLIVPKGWTTLILSESETMPFTFNAYPIENPEMSKVFWGISRKRNGQDIDLNGFKANQESLGHKVSETNGTVFHSMQAEFSDGEIQSFAGNIKAKSGNFVIVGAAPIRDSKSIEAIRAILKSLTFN